MYNYYLWVANIAQPAEQAFRKRQVMSSNLIVGSKPKYFQTSVFLIFPCKRNQTPDGDLTPALQGRRRTSGRFLCVGCATTQKPSPCASCALLPQNRTFVNCQCCLLQKGYPEKLGVSNEKFRILNFRIVKNKTFPKTCIIIICELPT